MNSSLVIVIVSYNCREHVRACLARVRDGRVIVVDNASTDATAAMVRAEFPEVALIENLQNCGFAAACNQGIAASNEPFVLLLNPDTLITDDAMRLLLEAMAKRPDVGACGPRILNADGSPQVSIRKFPTLGALVCDELGLSVALPRLFTGYRLSAWPLEKTGEVDQLGGSCLLLRRRALDVVGLLDERFFVYFEEVDLCRRLWNAGWRVRYVYEATIVHVGGQSSKTDRASSLRYRYRSLFGFYRKHHSRGQLFLLKLAVQCGAALRALAGEEPYRAIAGEVWKL
jgi:GT2 family glycosyltransferase